MNYVVLARKWRPQQFADLIGQGAIARTLENAIRLGRIHHALLFTGTRGVGKTTTARIFAKSLNCEKGPTVTPCGVCSNCVEIAAGANVDVREIDGASSTSVDDIRELKENVRYAPSKSKYKIYIIDEVHMLSTSAFNALLKTLEEPPPFVIFVFATTEPQKIPDTILSRCQRFDFRQISDDQIAGHLRKVVEAEKIEIGNSALALLSRQADGSLRDALSLLDQVIAFTGEKATEEEVVAVLGLTDRALISRTLEALIRHDAKESLGVLGEVLEKGFDPKTYLLEVWERVRDLLVLKGGGNDELVRATPDELARMKGWLTDLNEAELERWFDLLRLALNDVGRSEHPRFLMEATFLKMTRTETRLPLSELVGRLELLESRIAGKDWTAKAHVPPAAVAAPRPVQSSVSKGTAPSGDWESVVEAVKRTKPMFAGVLLQANGADLSAGKIVLTFDEGSFYVARAKEPDFQAFLCETASRILGSPHSLEIRTQPKSASTVDSKASVDRAREREALENPAVREAVSLFSAKIEEVKPIK
ncbi:MAG: DNA polymerase III subunit gamma/tau [Pseudomonadota bacterium]